jgi:5'-nucleotidase
MHILVTNDDGVSAPGIAALAAALRRIPGAKVSVMAPAQNQSDAGHRKTLRDPLRIQAARLLDGTDGFSCSGSPADAIAVALLGYVKDKVDIVVSGINAGPNVAQDITYSGTVTAAMEASIAGVPAIAVSLDSFDNLDFGPAAAFAVKLTPIVLEKGLPPLTLLNVNVPNAPIKGLKITRQGHRIYRDKLIELIDPEGKPYYWIGGERPSGHVEEVGTDVWAVAQGYISLTPIRLDMTDQAMMADIDRWGLWT